jgi:hypothetical protein
MDKQEDIFSRGIGNKESKQSLTAKPVVVLSVSSEGVYKKGTKEEDKPKSKPIGHKLLLICKHPDKEEPIKISEMRFIVGESVKTSTIWINVDEDGNIQKGSTVAVLLEKAQVENVNMLVKKTLPTELDINKFLAIKAY